MGKYKLKVVQNFTDQHTNKKYVTNQTIEVEEERALELFSSNHHVVKFVSREENKTNNMSSEELEKLKVEITTIKEENENLRNENENLKSEIEVLKSNYDNKEDKDKNK